MYLCAQDTNVKDFSQQGYKPKISYSCVLRGSFCICLQIYQKHVYNQINCLDIFGFDV